MHTFLYGEISSFLVQTNVTEMSKMPLKKTKTNDFNYQIESINKSAFTQIENCSPRLSLPLT